MTIIDKVENGPVLLVPDIHRDDRGYFYESFNDEFFRENVCDTTFVQDNQSQSSYGVLRGMHYQKGEYAQAKLIRVIKGQVVDVVLDIRQDSPNYGKYYSYYLSDKNHHQLFVPRGFAHGFLSLSDDTIFQYKCDNLYEPKSEGSYKFDSFGFKWTEYVTPPNLKVSTKDLAAEPFGKRRVVDIDKEKMSDLLSNYEKADLEFTVVSRYAGPIQVDEDLFAEIEDGENIATIKLDYITAPVVSINEAMPKRYFVGTNILSGKEKTLSRDFNEVKRFYRYE